MPAKFGLMQDSIKCRCACLSQRDNERVPEAALVLDLPPHIQLVVLHLRSTRYHIISWTHDTSFYGTHGSDSQ